MAIIVSVRLRAIATCLQYADIGHVPSNRVVRLRTSGVSTQVLSEGVRVSGQRLADPRQERIIVLALSKFERLSGAQAMRPAKFLLDCIAAHMVKPDMT